MAAICLVEADESQCFYHFWNDLENGIILGEPDNMYPNNIAKS